MTFDDRRDRIEHHGPRLLWEQVAEDLAADITTGRLAPGARLNTEMELAERYGVSRVTVRTAVKHLAEERGMVLVVHGRGTFVASAERWQAGEDAQA